MTAAPTAQPNDRHLSRPVQAGDILPTWCKVHGALSDHVYRPDKNPKLVCLECQKEKVKSG